MADQSPDRGAAADANAPFWLTGNFAPVFTEHTDDQLKVTGTIPPELNGRYLRNGPNPKNSDSAHWFLGDGMIHGVEIRDGRANWYRNRFVQTPYYKDQDANVLNSLPDKQKSIANTHIIAHAGKILALEELHFPYELTPELETVGPYDFGGKLKTGMTAHPKICGETGELLFFAYGIVPPFMTYHRVSADGELVLSQEIEVGGATMVHDFNITRNYVIFMDLPLVWDLAGGATDPGMPLRWDDDYPARLGVMPRDGGDVTWYDIDPCYVYHPVNAYEDGDRIVIDVCHRDHHMKAHAEEAPPLLRRWEIDQASGRVTETPIDDRPVEFPRVAEHLVGLKHRYSYMAELSDVGPVGRAIRKYDMQAGTSTACTLPAGQTAGEPVFIPAANSRAEDDGYLMMYVHKPETNTSDLVILSAQDVDGEPLARIHLPARVPAGFHGYWAPDQIDG